MRKTALTFILCISLGQKNIQNALHEIRSRGNEFNYKRTRFCIIFVAKYYQEHVFNNKNKIFTVCGSVNVYKTPGYRPGFLSFIFHLPLLCQLKILAFNMGTNYYNLVSDIPQKKINRYCTNNRIWLNNNNNNVHCLAQKSYEFIHIYIYIFVGQQKYKYLSKLK